MIEVRIHRPASRCFAAFTDAKLLAAWVPGLRRATLLSAGPRGEALIVGFEFGERSVYTLEYSYDFEKLSVAWHPRTGRREAVSGSATFVSDGGDCVLRYQLSAGPARPDANDANQRAVALISAFTRWVETGPRR